MKIKYVNLYLSIIFVIFCFYFLIFDLMSLLIFLVTYPMAAIFLSISLSQRNITLIIFSSFFMFAHGINPSFFFLNKEKYSRFGWNAINNFEFGFKEFISIYIYVYILMFTIFVFVIFFDRFSKSDNLLSKKNSIILSLNNTLDRYSSRTHDKNMLYSILLIIFVLVIALPQSNFMYIKQIGIVGLPTPELPLHLSGILYYFRRFIIPIVIFILYMKSNRTLLLALIIFLYATVAGVSSASRSVFMLSVISIIVFSIKDRKYVTTTLIVLLTLCSYQLISLSKNIVYFNWTDNLIELFSKSLDLLVPFLNPDLLMKFISDLSGRLYGSQLIVLAYQFDLDNNYNAIISFFTGGTVVANQAYSFFGFNLPDGMSFGVAIGLIGWLIVLANENIILLIVLGFLVSILISLNENLIRKIKFGGKNLSILVYPYCGLFVYLLWEPSVKYIYISSICLLLLIFANKKIFNKIGSPYKSKS